MMYDRLTAQRYSMNTGQADTTRYRLVRDTSIRIGLVMFPGTSWKPLFIAVVYSPWSKDNAMWENYEGKKGVVFGVAVRDRRVAE